MGAVKFVVLDNVYRCMESCYWHLIEKRFCFDEDIALYQEPVVREEKNNMFDNMAFYDSVSVIAGRAVVTIDPLPPKGGKFPIVQQPKRLRWQEQVEDERKEDASRSVPFVFQENHDDSTASSDSQEKMIKDETDSGVKVKKSVSFETSTTNETDNEPSDSQLKSASNLAEPEVKIRKKSLRERRMSKSLYLKIDYPKELPVIRQSSMPKFYLDTPEENQYKGPLTSLKSPMNSTDEFSYDLYSVVQIEKARGQSPKEAPQVHRSSSRLSHIKDKMKLRKSKSTVSASSIPHSNYI